jgi:competence protein ComGC
MSRFDEEPDGDIHGECEAEIQSLKYQLTNYRIAHERQAARITRLEAENAEARELLKRAEDNVTNAELSDEITAFRAKGATP